MVTSYIIKRILSIIPVLFIVSIIVFLIVHLAPGEPASVILGTNATEKDILKLKKELGHDLPLYEQFIYWIKDAVTGDLGNSIYAKKPVVELFGTYLLPTFSLTIFAQIIAVLISIPIGVIAAVRRGTFTDQFLMGMSLLGISIPSFLLGLFLILIFAVELNWFSIAGYEPLSNGFIPHIKSLILPALALSLAQAAFIVR